jgi:hypothetical protein
MWNPSSFSMWWNEQNEQTPSLLAFQMDTNKELRWTSDTMFKYFKITPNIVRHFGIRWQRQGRQYMASVLIMRKTPQLESVMAMYNQTLYDDPYLFTDYYNKATKDKRRGFDDNRHD